ncbi:hypothetical protein CDAR_465981 [Caerostris darwini]|uniref:Uncharacterized protein n=1 Tax=Caerostris darwini TaxID=1538125 RepID=A0AAV4WQE0_9ARAC|nr:hypothetical protein CDAR_465981 [Caerostris darwini]
MTWSGGLRKVMVISFFLSSISLRMVPQQSTCYLPSQVPPLTPGTNQKMAQAISASFSSWEKEREQYHITEDYTSSFLTLPSRKFGAAMNCRIDWDIVSHHHHAVNYSLNYFCENVRNSSRQIRHVMSFKVRTVVN